MVLPSRYKNRCFLITGKALGIDAVALRFKNVYGAGQSLSNPYTGILSIFSTRIKNGNDITIFEDGNESRDFVYIDDIVESIYLSIISSQVAGNSYNVGSGVCTDVLTVAETLKRLYNSNSKITINKNIESVIFVIIMLTCQKSIKIWVFRLLFHLKEGMRKFTDWVNKQDIQKDLYEQSIEEMKQKVSTNNMSTAS